MFDWLMVNVEAKKADTADLRLPLELGQSIVLVISWQFNSINNPRMRLVIYAIASI